jgi:F-type H+-transporting ATPase subunit b
MVEYITELVGFAVVVFVLGKWVVPPVNKAMTQRQEVIRRQLDEAEEARRRLAVAREEYEQAQAEARRIVEQAHQQIEADHQQTLNELQDTVGRLTAGLAERIVGDALRDDARQGRIVDRFLDEIEQRVRTGAR